MALKDQILNKIKAIHDPELLRELDALVNEMTGNLESKVNEPTKEYSTRESLKNRPKKRRLIANRKPPSTILKKLQQKVELKQLKTRLNGKRMKDAIAH